MSALDPPKSKPLVVRLSPRQKVIDELRRQLVDRNILIDTQVSLPLDNSKLSILETFLWRDIQDLLAQDYSEHSAISRALDKLREKPLFIETVEGLVRQYSEGEVQNG